MQGEVLAEVTRGDVVESVHAGHMVLLNADGTKKDGSSLSTGDILLRQASSVLSAKDRKEREQKRHKLIE